MNLVKLKDDSDYRESIIDSLCQGIKESSDFRNIIEYVIDNKLEIFSEIENDSIDEHKIIDCILPTIRRCYGKFFINPPEIFKIPSYSNLNKNIYVKKLELFELYFNIDQFIDYLFEIIPKVKNVLNDFRFLSKGPETLSLIVDNYIAMNIEKVQNINYNDIDNTIKILKRDSNLNKILNQK